MEEDNVVPVSGMVILNDSSFYTLCYPEHFHRIAAETFPLFIEKDGRL